MGELLKKLLLFASFAILLACQAPDSPAPNSADAASQERVAEYAIAIHGGAGTVDKQTEPERHALYEESLRRALQHGIDELAKGRPSLDVVEEVVAIMEDDPLFNAGRGAVFTHEGRHELDAAIMEGHTLRCGTVTGVTTVRHPIRLARRVMDQTRHIMFAGAGAEYFADQQPDIERVENEFFSTERRRQSLERALKKEEEARKQNKEVAAPKGGSTVGAVALDSFGNLAAATSTGGLTNKRFGRVGDVPIIGAGTYANQHVAVSCTGTGEQFMRHTVARDVASFVEHRAMTLAQAADTLINATLDPEDGGLIAVDKNGNVVTLFSTQAMPRGEADSTGRFEVGIW